jgi:hypothetical protein
VIVGVGGMGVAVLVGVLVSVGATTVLVTICAASAVTGGNGVGEQAASTSIAKRKSNDILER